MEQAKQKEHGIPEPSSRALSAIFAVELLERFSFWGFRVTLLWYFIQELQFSNANGLAFVSLVTCTAYLTPLLAAMLTDGLLGRYWVLVSFGSVYLLGFAIVTATTCTNHAIHWRRIFTFFGSFLVAFGAGAFESCLPVFGFDQLDAKKEPTGDKREEIEEFNGGARKGAAEYSRSQVYFSDFWFWKNMGGVLGFAVVPFVRGHFGSGPAFGLTTCAMVLAMVVFHSVRHEYVHSTNSDVIPLTTTFRCLWILFVEYIQSSRISFCFSSCRRGTNSLHLRPSEIVKHLDDTEDGLHVLTVMAFFIIPRMVFEQMYSLWVIQASHMNLHRLQPGFTNVLNFI